MQVNTLPMKIEFKHFLNSDSKLSTMTGIESFAVFATIVQMVKEVYKDKCEENSGKIDLRRKLDITDKIILTFVKLEQNMSCSCQFYYYFFIFILFYFILFSNFI